MLRIFYDKLLKRLLILIGYQKLLEVEITLSNSMKVVSIIIFFFLMNFANMVFFFSIRFFVSLRIPHLAICGFFFIALFYTFFLFNVSLSSEYWLSIFLILVFFNETRYVILRYCSISNGERLVVADCDQGAYLLTSNSITLYGENQLLPLFYQIVEASIYGVIVGNVGFEIIVTILSSKIIFQRGCSVLILSQLILQVPYDSQDVKLVGNVNLSLHPHSC